MGEIFQEEEESGQKGVFPLPPVSLYLLDAKG